MMHQWEILRRTARSFYITIRLLPRAVRDDVALAYLLARASDTIADTSTASPGERIDLLRTFRGSLGNAILPVYEADRWASFQSLESESRLLLALPELWLRMQGRGANVRVLMRQVMDSILQGQIFDLERFGPGAEPLSNEELERYTYLVAGSVGEFWDNLCRLRLRDFSTQPAETSRMRARCYGQALQLVNILRDRQSDAALGRVYIEPGRVDHWRRQARVWLRDGSAYCAGLRSGRLRYATLLPALLGWRTLALEQAEAPGSVAPVKVPRAEVRRWLLRAIPVWWSPSAVARLELRASK